MGFSPLRTRCSLAILGDIFDIDGGVVASHVILSGFFAWFVGGFLRTALLSGDRARTSIPFPDGALGLTEVGVALGSLVLLFAAFVAVQFRYFFGGDALISQTAGLSYADYARKGFFELVTVSALVLPVLLSANALLRRDTSNAVRVYRVLASTLLVLLAVIMYSAIARMRLYQSAYGLSTDRFEATVFMGWLALVLGWFAFTVLRGRDKRFVGGLLVSAWGTHRAQRGESGRHCGARQYCARRAREGARRLVPPVARCRRGPGAGGVSRSAATLAPAGMDHACIERPVHERCIIAPGGTHGLEPNDAQ